MNSKSKKYKRENEFFINSKTGKIQFNKLCQKCEKNCKQSFKVEIVCCDNFKKNELFK